MTKARAKAQDHVNERRLTSHEVAAMLGISPHRAAQLAGLHRIAHYRIAGRGGARQILRFVESSVQAYANSIGPNLRPAT
jgi:hypothetical protein